jgi:hypothetical protein
VTKATDRNRKLGVNRLLAGLSIFSEWASVNTNYLQAASGPSSGASVDKSAELQLLDDEISRSALLQSIVASPEVLRTESRARSSTRSVLTIVQDYLEYSISKFEASTYFNPQILAASTQLPLREHIELRGFIPLNDHIEVGCHLHVAYSFQTIKKSIVLLC